MKISNLDCSKIKRPVGILSVVWSASIVQKSSRTPLQNLWLCLWSFYKDRHPKMVKKTKRVRLVTLPDLSTAGRNKRMVRVYANQIRALRTANQL